MMYDAPTSANSNASLEDYVRAIRARGPLVLAMCAVGLLIAVWFTNTSEQEYEATSEVVLGPTLVGSTNGNQRSPVIEREAAIIESDGVLRLGAEAGGLPFGEVAGVVDVAFVPRSEVIEITYTYTDPDVAAAVVNGIAEGYVAQSLADEAAVLADGLVVIESQVDEVETAAAEALATVETLTAERERARASQTSPADPVIAAEIEQITAQLSTWQSTYNQTIGETRDRRRELALRQQALADLQPPAEVLALSAAGRPVGLGSGLIWTVGAILGLLAGVVAAIVSDRLDRSASDERVVAGALGSRVLGSLPKLPFSMRSGAKALFMGPGGEGRGGARARESVRRLRSSIQFLASTNETDGALVVATTSAFPGEGKSTTTANLALALAQSGSRTVLINADMRRPTVEMILGIDTPPGSGLSHALSTGSDLEPVTADDENLWVIPAGPVPANPAELLGSPAFEQIIKALKTEVDFILIDCPPVLSAADPLVVARVSDGVILVIDGKKTSTPALLSVRSELEQSGARILGAVLNRDRRSFGSRWSRDRYAYYG